MIVFNRITIRIGEIYFTEERQPDGPKADLIHFVGILTPRQEPQWGKSHTLLIDLSKDPETLLKEMDSGTRYEVRRAQSKDQLTLAVTDSSIPKNVEVFCDYYDEFAKSKSLRPVFRGRMRELAQHKNLLLTSASDAHGNILVQHAHLVMAERALLLYSASGFRQADDSAMRSLVGRANRLLHWQDMMTAMKSRIPLYDMCGVDVTNRSPETTRIAQFKQGFGGRVAPSFSRTIAASFKGIAAQAILKLAGKSF